MKSKKYKCKRCKDKRPDFADYLTEIFDFKLKSGKYKYNYCKACGQYYRREVSSDRFEAS